MKRRAFHVALVALLSLLATSSVWAQPPAQTYVFSSKKSYSDANPGDGACAATGGRCTLAAKVVPASTAGKTYYVRPDGGSAMQCTGLVDAPYPGSGSGQSAESSSFVLRPNQVQNFELVVKVVGVPPRNLIQSRVSVVTAGSGQELAQETESTTLKKRAR